MSTFSSSKFTEKTTDKVNTEKMADEKNNENMADEQQRTLDYLKPLYILTIFYRIGKLASIVPYFIYQLYLC